MDEFKDAIILFADNTSCSRYKNKKLKELNMPICRLIATNASSRGRNLDEENFYGLKNNINISINSKITLRKIFGPTKDL